MAVSGRMIESHGVQIFALLTPMVDVICDDGYRGETTPFVAS